ncbi:hypothetical protein BJ742DRAFT_787699 [Cladochytrium replicatum]|nr:hypothetical protein BJ742DRAFT_787699 [Cladochytrium replicatum]
MVRLFTQIDEVVPYEFPPVQMTRDQCRQRYRAGPVLVSIYPDMRHSLLLYTVDEAHSESPAAHLPSRTVPAPPAALAHAFSTDLQRSMAGSSSVSFQCEQSDGELPPPFFQSSLGSQIGSSTSAGTSAESSPVRIFPSVEERYARIRDHVAQYIQNVRRREAAASLRSTLINERTSLSSRSSGMAEDSSNQLQEENQRASTSSMLPPVSRALPQSAENSALIPPVDFSTLAEPIPVSNIWRSNRRRRYALDFDSLEAHEPTLPRRMSHGPFTAGLPVPPAIPMQATGGQPEIEAPSSDGSGTSADRIPTLSRLLVEHLNSVSTRPLVGRSSMTSGMETDLDPLGQSSSRFVRLWRDAWPTTNMIAAPEESRVTASPLPPLSSAIEDMRVDPPRISSSSSTIQNAALDVAFAPPNVRPLEPGTSVIRETGTNNSNRGSSSANSSGDTFGANRSIMINDAFTEFAEVAERALNDGEAGSAPATFPSASNLNPFLRILETHEDAMRELTSEVQDLASRWRMLEERLNPTSQRNPVRDVLRSLRNISPSPRNDLLGSDPDFNTRQFDGPVGEEFGNRFQSHMIIRGENEQLSGMEVAMERSFSLTLDERARLNRLRQGVHMLLESASRVDQMGERDDDGNDDEDDDVDDDEEESEDSQDDGEDDDDDEEENADDNDERRGGGSGMYDAYDEPFTDDGELDREFRREEGQGSHSGTIQSGGSPMDSGDPVPAFEYYFWMLMRAPVANRNDNARQQMEATTTMKPEWAEWIMTMELLERVRAGVKSMAEQIRRQRSSESFFRNMNTETPEVRLDDPSSSEPSEDIHAAIPVPVIVPSSTSAESSTAAAPPTVTALSPSVSVEIMRSGIDAASSARKRKRELDDGGEVTVR